MKKVAIMTWWHYSNYGTALQVTALYHVVTKMGYKVDVIDYIPCLLYTSPSPRDTR